MKAVFADSVYFFARINARDRLHDKAVRFSTQSGTSIVTTAWVLTEVADGLAGTKTRHIFARLLQLLKTAPDVEIVPPSPEIFERGLELYSQRPDKDWSLTDCISIVVMQDFSLTESLTSDHHFEQAGFTALLK